jgi:hypothetical protein
VTDDSDLRPVACRLPSSSVLGAAENAPCRAKENQNNAIMHRCEPAANSFTRGVGPISRQIFAANQARKITSDDRARFSPNENYRG